MAKRERRNLHRNREIQSIAEALRRRQRGGEPAHLAERVQLDQQQLSSPVAGSIGRETQRAYGRIGASRMMRSGERPSGFAFTPAERSRVGSERFNYGGVVPSRPQASAGMPGGERGGFGMSDQARTRGILQQRLQDESLHPSIRANIQRKLGGGLGVRGSLPDTQQRAGQISGALRGGMGASQGQVFGQLNEALRQSRITGQAQQEQIQQMRMQQMAQQMRDLADRGDMPYERFRDFTKGYTSLFEGGIPPTKEEQQNFIDMWQPWLGEPNKPVPRFGYGEGAGAGGGAGSTGGPAAPPAREEVVVPGSYIDNAVGGGMSREEIERRLDEKYGPGNWRVGE